MSRSASDVEPLEAAAGAAEAEPPQAAAAAGEGWQARLQELYLFLASYGLSCTLFLLLFLLTLLGTLAQQEMGLYAVQKKYFESFVAVVEVGGVPLALPGGYLLMIALGVNMVLGGVVRIRKTRFNLGVLIAHLGVVLLLFAGWTKLHYAEEGHLQLYEGERASAFVSDDELEVVIFDASQRTGVKEYAIPAEWFHDLAPGAQRRFRHPDLPFELTLFGFLPNCKPEPAGHGQATAPVVDGFFLKERRGGTEVPGIYVSCAAPGQPPQQGILWGNARYAFAFHAGPKAWAVDLRPKQYPLPFTVVLDDFTRELYPRTNIPKVFRSDVTKIEDGVEQQLKISMNEPFRHHGYTLFQSSWGPEGAAPGERLYSVFSVVKNPSDHWPLYACIVISIGLLITYGQKLQRYIKAQGAGRRA